MNSLQSWRLYSKCKAVIKPVTFTAGNMSIFLSKVLTQIFFFRVLYRDTVTLSSRRFRCWSLDARISALSLDRSKSRIKSFSSALLNLCGWLNSSVSGIKSESSNVEGRDDFSLPQSSRLHLTAEYTLLEEVVQVDYLHVVLVEWLTGCWGIRHFFSRYAMLKRRNHAEIAIVYVIWRLSPNHWDANDIECTFFVQPST